MAVVCSTPLFLIIKQSHRCLAIYPQNYLIEIFIHLKICLADAIHNFKCNALYIAV